MATVSRGRDPAPTHVSGHPGEALGYMQAALEKPPRSPTLIVITVPREAPGHSRRAAQPGLGTSSPSELSTISFPCEQESKVTLAGSHSSAGETGAREGKGWAPRDIGSQCQPQESDLSVAAVGVQN